MKANSLDHTQSESAKDKSADEVCSVEVPLEAVELEDVIVPGIAANHNETIVENDGQVYLEVEETEEVIAPKLGGIEGANHNETLVSDEVALSVEELEEI